MRIFLLVSFGGLYADVDIAPPRIDGQVVDPASVFPMRNLKIMSERWCRNVGADTAVMVGNGFLMAGVAHPFLVQLLASMRVSIAEAMARKHLDAAFVTGPYFLSHMLSGAITIVPQRNLRKLRMFCFEEDKLDDPYGGKSSSDGFFRIFSE